MEKKLYRSKEDRIIAGVCGGVAEYLGADVSIIRLLWFVSLFMGGLGIFAYIAAFIIVPEGDGQALIDGVGKGSLTGSNDKDRTKWLGIILIVIGVLFIMQNWFFWIRFRDFWPLILVVFGAVILFKGLRDK